MLYHRCFPSYRAGDPREYTWRGISRGSDKQGGAITSTKFCSRQESWSCKRSGNGCSIIPRNGLVALLGFIWTIFSRIARDHSGLTSPPQSMKPSSPLVRILQCWLRWLHGLTSSQELIDPLVERAVWDLSPALAGRTCQGTSRKSSPESLP